MTEFRFSVFTATYNRANFLNRVYKSLISQTFKNFEWIVVDDGSTDNTEDVIKKFIAEGKLKSIRYIKKKNGGKHTAWRVATDEFKAEYVVAIDSDDTLTSDALEIFDRYWKALENSKEYDDFWEVKGRVQNERGEMVGTALPKKVFDSSADEITFKYKIKGEMEGCRKTSVLRKEAKVPENFIFEEYCSCLTESIRWSRAGKIYKTRYFDEVVRTYYHDAEITISTSNRGNRNLKNTYNNLIAAIFALEERREPMIKWDKFSYFKTIAVILYTSFCLNLNPLRIPIKNLFLYDKVIFIVGYLPIYILYKIRG